MSSGGTARHTTRAACPAVQARAGWRGTRSRRASRKLVTMKASAINRPGMMLATNSLGMETLTVAP